MKGRAPGRPSARRLALDALLRVTRDRAYAAAALSQLLEESDLPPVERGLSTELCYGVLRTESYLRRRLERHAELGRTDPEVALVLVLGAYQLEFLDRVPAHAAVSETVELAAPLGKWATGFVNAVLRKVATDTDGRLAKDEAAWTSAPAWLRKRLERDVGAADARALLVPEAPPRADLRRRPGRALPDTLLEPTLLEDAFRFAGGGDPARLPGHGAGDFQVQELGSQIVARLVRAQPGELILDACAGRGQKTACLLDAGAEVVATDLHEHKLRALTAELGRYGLSARTRHWDATTEPPAEFLEAFDAVLLDAPCTGTGTLRRRPEIARRLSPDSPRELGALQAALLRQLARCLRPGGRLVYSTCSVLCAEAEEVLAQAADVLSEASLPALALPGLAVGASSVRLLPTTTQTDGYFVAQMVRRSG